MDRFEECGGIGSAGCGGLQLEFYAEILRFAPFILQGRQDDVFGFALLKERHDEETL